MEYKEVKHNIFNAPEDWYLAHCISRDAAMGAGIAKEFVKRFPELKELRGVRRKHTEGSMGGCKQVGRILNLTTKENYYDKPTYNSIRVSLECMRDIVEMNGISKIAMPKIGSGLDRLEWNKVRQIIKEVFINTDVKIVVCYL